MHLYSRTRCCQDGMKDFLWNALIFRDGRRWWNICVEWMSGYRCLKDRLWWDCQWDTCELQMNNRSSISLPLFFVSELSIHHFARLLPPHLYHLLYLSFFLSSCADWMHQREFPYASSWESAVALITEWLARSHIWQPLAGSPLPSLLHHSSLYWADWIETRRWLLHLLKKQSQYRTKTLMGGLSFISELSRGYTCSCSRAFQRYNAKQHL